MKKRIQELHSLDLQHEHAENAMVLLKYLDPETLKKTSKTASVFLCWVGIAYVYCICKSPAIKRRKQMLRAL